MVTFVSRIFPNLEFMVDQDGKMFINYFILLLTGNHRYRYMRVHDAEISFQIRKSGTVSIFSLRNPKTKGFTSNRMVSVWSMELPML